jgi:hypothetical protein
MEPYVLGREEGEAIWMFDALDAIKAAAERTAAALALWSSSTSRASTARRARACRIDQQNRGATARGLVTPE